MYIYIYIYVHTYIYIYIYIYIYKPESLEDPQSCRALSHKSAHGKQLDED